MNIDISHISYWSVPTIIAAGVWGLAVVFLAYGTHRGHLRDSYNLFSACLGLLLFVLTFGSLSVFGGVGAGTYELKTTASKIEQLEEKYDNVNLRGNEFVASLGGRYVEGVLADKGNGQFIVLEEK